MADLITYKKLALTGGGATALDGIDGAALVGNELAFVTVSGIIYHYILDASSGAAESSPGIISPDTNAGDKRWILQDAVPAAQSTGTGNVVRATSPTLVTPTLGTPASGNLSNCTVDDPTTDDGIGDRGYNDQRYAGKELVAKGPGYFFDGVDNKIDIADSDNLTANKFSIVSIMRPLRTPPSQDTILAKAGSDTNREYVFSIASDLKPQIILGNSSGSWAAAAQKATTALVIDAVCAPSVTYDGTTISFYNQGVPDGSASISTTFKNTTSTPKIGFDGANYANFDMFRLLYFNLALTAAEVLEYSNGAPIPYKYGGASQTALTSGTLIIGKHYTIDTFEAGDDFTNVGAASNASGVSFVATGTTPTTWANGSSLRHTGCVAQYEQDGIGHNQWIDKSGNELHGTVSGAIPINLPPDHTEKYVDLTLTGNSSFTLPMGYKITSILVKETAGNALTGGLDCGLSANGVEIVSGMAVGASATVLCTLVEAGTIGATCTTADDTIYFSDGDDDGNFNGAELEVRVNMERLVT
jgi:hypothetical protein